MQEAQKINEALNLKIREMDQVIDRGREDHLPADPVPHLLPDHRQPARPPSPRYDLLMVEQSAFIAVLMTDGQQVKNKLFRLPTPLSDRPAAAAEHPAEHLVHRAHLGAAGSPLWMRVSTHAGDEAYGLIHLVVSFAMEVLEELEAQRGPHRRHPHPAGPSGVPKPGAGRTPDELPFRNGGGDASLPVIQNEHVKILIGPENVVEELKDSSVIMASYNIGGGMQGVIGVVGPTRMDYADLAARLSYFAEGLSRMFGKDEIPPPAEPHPEDKEE